MTFAASGFLAGLVLCAVPLLVHLLHHRQAAPVRWAMMAFLERAEASRRRAIRLKHWVLLIVRTLLVAIVVLLFARPILHVRAGGPLGWLVPRSAAILLDTSWSMTCRHGEGTTLERARTMAAEVAAGLEGHRIEVLYVADDLIAAADSDRDGQGAVLKAVAEAEPTYRTTNLSLALTRLAERVQAGDSLSDVFLITDNQAIGWTDRSAQCNDTLRKLSEQARVHILVPFMAEGETVANSAVVELSAGPIGLADTSTPERFTVRVVNHGPARSAKLRFLVDGVQAKEETLQLPAHGTVASVLDHQFTEPGTYAVSAELDADALPADDRRWKVVDVGRQVPVLCIDSPEAHHDPRSPAGTAYLWAFLAPARPEKGTNNSLSEASQLFRPKAVFADALATLDREFPGVVVLADVPRLEANELQSLSAFVEAGGGVSFFLGPHVDGPWYNDNLYRDGWGLLPARLTQPYGRPLSQVQDLKVETFPIAAPADRGHPIFNFANPGELAVALGSGLFSMAYGVVELDDAQSAPATVPEPARSRIVARFANGKPCLLEKRFGAGHVLLYTTGCDLQWGTMPLSPVLAVVDRSLRYLTAQRFPDRNLSIGRTLVLPLRGASVQPSLIRPDSQQLEVDPESTESGTRAVVYRRTDLPGTYRVKSAAARPEWFAVNVDTAESDLLRIPEAELRTRYPDFRFSLAGAAERSDGSFMAARPIEIWPVLGSLLLLLALGETLLARVLTPHRNQD